MSVAVIDIGKTNAKVVLVADDGTEIAERRRPNTVLPGPPYPHFDADGLWSFVLESLADFAPRVGAVVPVTHGACAALVDEDGALALPVLDYEHAGPDEARPTYAPPPFSETGSPPLPGGLNLGAQLHWLEARHPQGFARARALLTWPQWWAFRLSGVMASEVTSLGCHTDLWDPLAGRPSTLAVERGWAALLPPLRGAAEILGPAAREVAAATGLGPRTPIHAGIHDSNASLLPYLHEAPCGVLSTGTWVIAMALGGRRAALDPARDRLLNVAADGRPVPTARFMGGRRRDAAIAAGEDESAVDARLARRAATDLEEIGAEGPIFVEGPFAASDAFMRALSDAAGREARTGDATGTARGAALLARMGADPSRDRPAFA